MPSYITGRQSTGTVLQAERKIDTPPEVFWLQKDLTPLVHISGGGGLEVGSKSDGKLPAKKKVCVNPEFKVLEKEPRGRWTAVNYSTGYTAGATTIICDSVAHIQVGDIVKNVVKEEVVYVTARDTGANTITVVRGFGATAAAAWADNEPLLRLATQSEENQAPPTIHKVQNRLRTNYCGIFRDTLGLSRTAQNSEYYGGKKKEELRQESLIELKKNIEYAFLWSEPYEDLTGPVNGAPIRTTGGLWYWGINGGGNVTTATTTFTKSGWLSFVRSCFQYGDAMVRVALCSPLVIEMLDYWKDGKLQMKPSEYLYGIKVAEWETGNGTLLIVRDTILQNSPYGTTTAGYGGVAIVFDPDLVQYRYLQNSDVALYENVVRDGTDGFTDEHIAEVGLGVINPENISILKGVTTYA
ncbi:MAG: DUF5309 family protein [Candidatus Zixiibacteriota bacterium]